jgi:hypothetical protein
MVKAGATPTVPIGLPEPHLAIPSLLAEGAATSTAMRLVGKTIGNTVARVPCRCSAVCDTIFSSVQVFLA